MKCFLLFYLGFHLAACGQSAPPLLPGVDSLTRQSLKDTVLPKLTPLFTNKGISPGDSILIRIFKQEKELELWVAKGSGLVRVHTFFICAASGKPGPKRKQGDMQVPEGFYVVDEFNPNSSFHLSFRVNYPNAADRFFADKTRPGGDIYIHGRCASIGCVAIEDGPIEILYLAAILASEKGQVDIPVHIFPCRMEPENLRLMNIAFPQNQVFWQNLQLIYYQFERKPRFMNIRVDGQGSYFSDK